MSKLETNTIDNISGSSTLTIGDSNTSTITLKSGATLTNFPANTPAFEANLGSDQTPSNDVNTLVVFDTERYDTDSAYDTSTGKFQPQTAGKYFVYGSVSGESTVNNGNLYKTATFIFFNGSALRTQDIIGENQSDNVFGRLSVPTSAVITFNGSSDYVQLYANIQTRTGGNVKIESNDIRTYFGAYKIIGA